MAKIIDEVWKPADFDIRKSDRFKKVDLDFSDYSQREDLKGWRSDDFFSDTPEKFQIKQTPEEFINNYLRKREKMSWTLRSPESDYHALMADRFAVQNGENNIFSGLHRNMARGLEQTKRSVLLDRTASILNIEPSKLKDAIGLAKANDTEQTGMMGGGIQVADILGIDALRLKRAMSMAREAREREEINEKDNYVSSNDYQETNDLFNNKRESYNDLASKNAFGMIDINVIFIRDWLEEKGTSWFGNKFSLFIIIFLIVFVGGVMTLMLSGVLGDLIKTGIPKFIEF
jgi:hypothetical protein